MDDVGVEALSRCVDNIEELFLDECNVTEEGISALAEKIGKQALSVITHFSRVISKNSKFQHFYSTLQIGSYNSRVGFRGAPTIKFRYWISRTF